MYLYRWILFNPHSLVGSPATVRQTIHLLHTLHYAETVLWSPIMTTEKPLIITPAEGKSISLLRKHLYAV